MMLLVKLPELHGDIDVNSNMLVILLPILEYVS